MVVPINKVPIVGNMERRAFNTVFKRMDEDGTGRTVSGYAAVFNSETAIGGWYKEVIEPGAFDDALSVSDCRALFNHKVDHLLARQSSGTLKLSMKRDWYMNSKALTPILETTSWN